jgi:hypothetical protein
MNAELKARLEAVLSRHADDVIAIGTTLAAIKDSLKSTQGAFKAFCEVEVPFGYRHARDYITIATDPNLSGSTISTFPGSMGALKALTGLPKEAFDASVASGEIHPRLRQPEAYALRERILGKPKKPPRDDSVGTALKALYNAQVEVLDALHRMTRSGQFTQTGEDASLPPGLAREEIRKALAGERIANRAYDRQKIDAHGIEIVATSNATSLEGVRVVARLEIVDES